MNVEHSLPCLRPGVEHDPVTALRDALLDGHGVARLQHVVGEPVDPVTGTARLFIPLSFQDIRETMEEHGVAKGAAISILQIFGMRVQTYGGR